ncbi:flagellar motor switch phosphatase FliY [Ammoniphilus sp. CFH 90114]|uniref:flagellar motor switch phosphatase FliY n=1 Tax=Ammoniphilus sp. CFH 90114 TaxID=2493665 RepID=UPI00100F1BAB|nr:flagellar motor switch phosphatase FliY [Ammoniphilus sp. CFH 90114]RXT15123.1 flagellar motor switch phosphatase FliY [Ammoniphilus sp. CFH 90114]
MNNRDMLSQEEIDALLRQNNLDEQSLNDNENLNIDTYLTPMEQDALGEIGNICFGSSATALSTLLGKKTDITTPTVSVVEQGKLSYEFPHPHVAVHVEYTEGFKGINLLVIHSDDAKVIADLMMGGDGTNRDIELTELHISAVQEAMNQMMGSAATSMSTLFNKRVDISPPGIDLLDFSNDAEKGSFPDEKVFIKISFRLKIGDLIDSNIMQLLPVSFAKEMVSLLLGGGSVEAEESIPQQSNVVSQVEKTPPSSQQPMEGGPVTGDAYGNQPPGHSQPMYPPPQHPYPPPPMYHQQVPGYPYQQPMYPPPQQPMYAMPNYLSSPSGGVQQPPNVQHAQFSPFHIPGTTPAMDDRNLNLLLDIPLQVTVELGRTKKQIKDILEMSAGSIIELDKLAGEPVDIFVNNKLIAKGEVVVIEENFGVRVTDIISQWDRVQKLQ